MTIGKCNKDCSQCFYHLLNVDLWRRSTIHCLWRMIKVDKRAAVRCKNYRLMNLVGKSPNNIKCQSVTFPKRTPAQ